MSKTWYKIRSAFYRFQKRLRLARIGTKKYNKVSIDEKVFNNLRQHHMFLAAIQLSRIVNSLLSCTRIYLSIPDNGKLVNLNDKIEMLFISGSILYEGVLEFGRLSRRLKQLSVWNKMQSDISFINKQLSDKKSLLHIVLKSIRNEATFHFEEQMIIDAFKDMELSKRTDFAVSSGPKYDDIVYTIVDNIRLKYITDKSESGVSSEVFYQKLMDYIGNLGTRLTEVLSEMLVEILAGISSRRVSVLEA